MGRSSTLPWEVGFCLVGTVAGRGSNQEPKLFLRLEFGAGSNDHRYCWKEMQWLERRPATARLECSHNDNSQYSQEEPIRFPVPGNAVERRVCYKWTKPMGPS
eukprot:EG_transcript_66423